MADDMRQLMYPSEREFFKRNRDAAGRFTEDGRVQISPYWPSTRPMRDAVRENEALRLQMPPMSIAAAPTDQQRAQFQGGPYEQDELALRQTLAARQMTGDPSGGQPTVAVPA